MSRQHLRRYRLLELEKEQYLDDAKGLVLTEEQRQSLLDPFVSVKVEFHDLDGLRWTQTALRHRQHSCHHHTDMSQTHPDYSSLVVQPTDSNIDATVRCSTNYIDASSHSPNQRVNRNPSIISPSFWHADSITNDLLRFPVPPCTIPPLPSPRTVRGYVGGLGFASSATGAVQRHYAPRLEEHADIYGSVIYSTPSPVPSWAPFALDGVAAPQSGALPQYNC